jgi:hypothetical protein
MEKLDDIKCDITYLDVTTLANHSERPMKNICLKKLTLSK